MFTFPTTFFGRNNSNYSTTVLSFNPAVYWRLEETTGTSIIDTSTNNRSGTISGTYTLNQDGSLTDSSKSILFTNGVIKLNTNITVPTTNITMVVRAKTSASSAGICVFTNNESSLGSESPGLYLINNKAEFYYFTSSAQYLTSANNYNDNNWHSYAISIGASGAKLYVDGSLITSNVAHTTIASFSGFWLVGKSFAVKGDATPINGNIDEFAYFTTQLTDANILAIHQSV